MGLQVDVDGEPDVVALTWLVDRDDVDELALGVDLDRAHAGLAAQVLLGGAFDAALADRVARPVGRVPSPSPVSSPSEVATPAAVGTAASGDPGRTPPRSASSVSLISPT